MAASLSAMSVRGAGRPRAALKFALLAVVGVAAWEGAVRLFDLPPSSLPAPSVVAGALLPWLLSGVLVPLAWETLADAAPGLLLGGLGGLAAAALLVRLALPARLPARAGPVVGAAPWLLLAALTLLWLALDWGAPVLLAALSSGGAWLVALLGGERRRALGGGVGATLVPAVADLAWPWRSWVALPVLRAGLSAALGFAVAGAVIGEFAGGDTGLGALLCTLSDRHDVALVYGVLIVLAGLRGLVAVASRLTVARLAQWRAEREDEIDDS